MFFDGASLLHFGQKLKQLVNQQWGWARKRVSIFSNTKIEYFDHRIVSLPNHRQIINILISNINQSEKARTKWVFILLSAAFSIDDNTEIDTVNPHTSATLTLTPSYFKQIIQHRQKRAVTFFENTNWNRNILSLPIFFVISAHYLFGCPLRHRFHGKIW
jgi:hypothetical protein